MTNSREQVLQQIAKHDGEWGWYQLDRALSRDQVHLGRELIAILKSLEEEGLISSSPGATAGHPRYHITKAGQAVVAQSNE